MDRDKRWDRVKKSYDALVRARGACSGDLVTTVEEAYSQGEYDEFIQAHGAHRRARPTRWGP